MNFNELFGSIPDGWRSCTLGELVREFNGSIQTGPFGSQLHAADYVEDGIPSIMPKNIRIDGVDDSDIARVSPEDIERLSKYKVQTGDIVYSRRGDVEKCSLITERENGWLCGTGCLRVRLQAEEVSPEFIHAYLCHPVVREWIVRHAVGATMPNLNTSILSALPVLVPTSDSMEVITSNWNALSSKLVINSKINQTLEQMAQAIFKSWFVDFDPVKAKMNGEQPEGMDAATASLFPEKLVESELGLIPDGWEVSTLSSLIKLTGGGTPKRSEERYWNGDIPWFSVRDVPSGSNVFVVDTDEKITELGLNKSSTKLLPKGTTIITARGTVGKLALVGTDMCMNQSCYGIRGKEVGDFYNYFNLNEAVSTLQRNTHGAVFDTITTKTFDTYSMAFSGAELANKFDALVAPLLQKIEANVRQNIELATLRDTLLPKLLSGEIELDTTINN